jgi:hypothetical protein
VARTRSLATGRTDRRPGSFDLTVENGEPLVVMGRSVRATDSRQPLPEATTRRRSGAGNSGDPDAMWDSLRTAHRTSLGRHLPELRR